MRSVLLLAIGLLAASLDAFDCEQQPSQLAQQQVGARILRRVIKSTPTATNLARVRLVTIRSSNSGAATERGAVSEISSKEAASFGQRSSANETVSSQAVKSGRPAASATTAASTSSSSTTTTSTTITTTPTSTTSTSTTSTATPQAASASERLQAAPAERDAVEVLSSAPSSWQLMGAVETPATAALIAAGTRPVAAADLTSSSSEESNDVLRSTASATKASFTQSNTIGETFSRLRQSKTSQRQQQKQEQQSFFYPQQQRQQSKTNYQASKTHWYQPSSTTARPAPIIQQQQQQYEQQSEQYVEQQQQQVEAAPPGLAEPFAFDFNTQDSSGNGQYRKEESDRNGVVRGSYGYTDANGIYRHVEYVADQNGFRANIKSNEPGLIGETQPASIRLDGGSSGQPAAAAPQRLPASHSDNSEWSAASSNERADLALAPPDFESSHKAERIRATRHSRN